MPRVTIFLTVEELRRLLSEYGDNNTSRLNLRIDEFQYRNKPTPDGEMKLEPDRIERSFPVIRIEPEPPRKWNGVPWD